MRVCMLCVGTSTVVRVPLSVWRLNNSGSGAPYRLRIWPKRPCQVLLRSSGDRCVIHVRRHIRHIRTHIFDCHLLNLDASQLDPSPELTLTIIIYSSPF